MVANNTADLQAQLEQQEDKLKAIQSQPLPVSKVYSPLNDKGFLLGSTLLGFSLMVMAIMAYLIKNGSDTQSLLRTFGTVLIIVASLFLIIVGYDEQQISPVIGLLGTIAGYLLGQSKSSE